jgi:hypothetical protein
MNFEIVEPVDSKSQPHSNPRLIRDANAWIHHHHRHLERSGLTDQPSRSALSFR